MTTGAHLVTLARAKGLFIVTAESCTAGMLSAAITEAAGSSDIFDCGFVTYSNAAKIRMLGVDPGTLADFGAVSEQVAAEMAAGALAGSEANIALSITGIAGPGPSEHKPEGRVCFGLARKGHLTSAHTVDFGALGRAQVRRASTEHALGMLIDAAG